MQTIEYDGVFEVRINPISKILKDKDTGKEVTVYAIAKTFKNNNGTLKHISTTWTFHTPREELEENK